MKSRKTIREVKILFEIDKIELRLKKKHNYVVNPDAKLYVARQVNLAIENRVIKLDEITSAAAALISVGARGTRQNGNRHIQPMNIQKIWQDIKMGPGNCPPNECLFRTVIDRKVDFGDEFPLFNELTNK